MLSMRFFLSRNNIFLSKGVCVHSGHSAVLGTMVQWYNDPTRTVKEMACILKYSACILPVWTDVKARLESGKSE
jgi:hypothetical protein